MRINRRALAFILGPALLLSGIAAAPANAGTPAALWHMDELTGQMIDSSGHGNNGTLSGTVAQAQVPAVSGFAYRFTGPKAAVTVPSSASLNPGSANITLTVHANFTALPSSDYDMIRKGLSTTTGGDYKLEVLDTGRVFCLFRGSTKVQKTASKNQPKINDGSYHTLQCVKTSNSVEVFVDGVSYGSKSGTAGSISNTDDLVVGAKNTSGDDQYNGLMDEVEVDVG